MNKKKWIACLLCIAMACSLLSACKKENPPKNDGTEAGSQTTAATTENTQTEATPPAPQKATPLDIDTIGGVVVVGTVGHDDAGWFIAPEQPLNITYTYFLDNPSVFPEQTRIRMLDPKDDGMEKSVYLGQTVTVSGIFRFIRDDFETLYLFPFQIAVGKTVEKSHSAPELIESEIPKNLYDPTKPLPKYMAPLIMDGRYNYNAFMLSEETLQLMGNDFSVFYINVVDAVLNYTTEVACPEEEYAEMLGTVMYYEFPLFNACAEPFEFFKHYDRETKTIRINYKNNAADHEVLLSQFLKNADALLANVSPKQSEIEKAKTIYNALCTRMTYDDSALTDFERKESHYAYLQNSGVCITFANVYNQLLTQVGIKTTLAHCDYTQTMGHTWSMITLDGKQYFCDPTFELSKDGGAGYRYFGMNYADRTAGGLGKDGIRAGRYNMQTVDASMLAAASLKN